MATTSASTVLAWVAVSSPPVSMLHERGEVLGRQRLGAVDGEVVLDVGEHAAGVGAGRDGGDGQLVEVALDGEHDGVVGRSRARRRRRAWRRRSAGSGGSDASMRAMSSAVGSSGTRSGSGKYR